MGIYLALFFIMWKYAPRDDEDVELIEDARYVDDENIDNINSSHGLTTDFYNNYLTSPISSERSRSTTRSVDEIRLRASFG